MKTEELESALAELETLRTQNLYLNNILLNLPEQFYWMDLDGRIVMCNERQATYFGLKPEDFMGMNCFDIVARLGWDVEVANQVRQNDLYVMATGESVVREECFEFEGESRTFLSYKYPLYDANHVLTGVFGLSIDITDRKKMELEILEQKHNAEAANAAKTNFLMNISHDVRTPFSGIIGYTEILLQSETSPEKKEMLNEILASSEYLLELLDDIIDVTKLEDNHVVDIHSFDFIQSVKKMALLMKLEAKQKKLTLKVHIDKNVPKVISSNRKSIERILLNLLGNAIKFTHEGGVELSISCLHRTEKQISLRINVDDTGIGISQDKLDTIFNRFSRLTPNNNHSYKGTGLGLWIVKGLVEQLGGQIAVTSLLNQGTQFSVTINVTTSASVEQIS